MVDKVDGIKRLLEIMASSNPAEVLDDELLASVGDDVIDQFGEDLDSMEEWIGLVEKGRELMKQDFNARSKPWDDAANFKSPLIMNAVLTFGDTSSQELLRKSDVVKSMVLGPDPDGQREAQGFRVSTYMNYQVNVEMTGVVVGETVLLEVSWVLTQ